MTAFNELDRYVSIFEKDSALIEQYWHDDCIDEALEILKRFREEDWDDLVRALPGRSAVWQRRLADCLRDKLNPHHRRALELMADTRDPQLFKAVLMALMRQERISDECGTMIRARLRTVLPGDDAFGQMIANGFLKWLERTKK